jgi:hypothetical protein
METEKIEPPHCSDDGSCDSHARTMFDTKVSAAINAHATAIKDIGGKVEGLIKLKTQALTLGTVIIFCVGAIQYIGNLYVSAMIAEKLAPISEKLSELQRRDEINKLLVKPETLAERMDAMKGTLYSVDDRVKMLDDRVRALEKKGKP